MDFFRPILLILFLTGMSLAGLIIAGAVFPGALDTGSGGFLVYVAGASVIFLFFLKGYRKRGSAPEDKAVGIEPRPAGSSHDAPHRKLEEIRTRIRDRKKQRK